MSEQTYYQLRNQFGGLKADDAKELKADGRRPVKIVSVVDEHTRECFGGLVERSITSNRLIDELDRLAAGRDWAGDRGRPVGPPTR